MLRDEAIFVHMKKCEALDFPLRGRGHFTFLLTHYKGREYAA